MLAILNEATVLLCMVLTVTFMASKLTEADIQMYYWSDCNPETLNMLELYVARPTKFDHVRAN